MAHQLIKYLRKSVERWEKNFVPSVIVYENRKQDAIILDASTFEKWQQCFLWLFGFLRDTWECYGELVEEDEDKDPYAGTEMQDPQTPSDAEIKELQYQRGLYQAACEGDWAAAYELLHFRKDWEYEEWNEVRLTDPTKRGE